MTPTPLATGTATGKARNVQRVDYEATHTTTARKEGEENFTAKDATGIHIQIPLVQDVTPTPPGSKSKAIIHPGQSTTQSQQQSQATITTTTTPQGLHQHRPVLEALLTSPNSS